MNLVATGGAVRRRSIASSEETQPKQRFSSAPVPIATITSRAPWLIGSTSLAIRVSIWSSESIGSVFLSSYIGPATPVALSSPTSVAVNSTISIALTTTAVAISSVVARTASSSSTTTTGMIYSRAQRLVSPQL